MSISIRNNDYQRLAYVEHLCQQLRIEGYDEDKINFAIKLLKEVLDEKRTKNDKTSKNISKDEKGLFAGLKFNG